MTLEGNAYLQLYTMIRGDKTAPVNVKLATIQSVNPLSIRIDGESIDTPAQGIVVSEHLTEHKRVMSLSGGTISGQVNGANGALTSLTATDVNVTIKSNLNVGNRVIVLIGNDGQLAYIIDKAVV